MTDDDDDIYSDLSCINIANAEPKVDEEKIKLQNLLEEKEQELNEIRESKNALEKEKKTLEENISSLYKTAINELKKKDAVIVELTRQKDTILFRRGRRHNLDETNGNSSNATQAICNKQPLIASDDIINESAKCRSDSVPSCNQKTLSETVCAIETTIKEDTSFDNSSVKCGIKFSGSKLDLPLKDGGEGSRESRSQSSERNPEELFSSHSQRSSRSAYFSSSRSNYGERRKGERSSDSSRHHSSYQKDRKQQRYDAQEGYKERGQRYHSRSHLRSPSPKRRRSGACPRDSYYDWKKRNSRSNYCRQPPSDSVRVAAQVKSKYSKARERSLSRTPVKKQKDMKEVVSSSPELLVNTSVTSKRNLRDLEDTDIDSDGTLSNNHFPLSKCILDPKDTSLAQGVLSIASRVRKEGGKEDEGLPPKDTGDGEKDMFLPSDKNPKIRPNYTKQVKSPRDPNQAQEHRNRDGVHITVTKHQSKREINRYIDADTLSNDIKTKSTKKGCTPKNIQPKEVIDKKNPDHSLEDSSHNICSEVHLKEDIVSEKSKSKTRKEGNKSSRSLCRREEDSRVPIQSADVSKQDTKETEVFQEKHLTKKITDLTTNVSSMESREITHSNQTLRRRNSAEKVIKRRKDMSPPVSYIEQQSRISKDNSQASINKSPLVDRGTDGQKHFILPETPVQTPREGIMSKSRNPLLTPPLKATVALKVSPSFEDPAVINDHKFSYTVFNEQCDFKRPKRKSLIRLSGVSCENETDLSSNVQRKSDSSLYINKLDEIGSESRVINQGKLTTLVKIPLTTVNMSESSEKLCNDLLVGRETLSTEIESFQKECIEERQDEPKEHHEANTKQASGASNLQSECSNERSRLVSNRDNVDSSSINMKTSLSTSKTTRNHGQKSFSNISHNCGINKGKDFKSVKDLQNNPKQSSSKENLSIIKKADKAVKERNILNDRVRSKELESNISSVEKVDKALSDFGKEKCKDSSFSSQDNRMERCSNLSEKTTNSNSPVKAVSSERGIVEKVKKVDSICNALKANLEKKASGNKKVTDEDRKQELDKKSVSKSGKPIPREITNTALGSSEGRETSNESSIISVSETLKSESDHNKIVISGSDKLKPEVQRTIIVSKFRRKNANFQDSPTPVLTQVKSSTK